MQLWEQYDASSMDTVMLLWNSGSSMMQAVRCMDTMPWCNSRNSMDAMMLLWESMMQAAWIPYHDATLEAV
jgi:putative hemolysin